MNVYPVKFEAYEDGFPVFNVSSFDESTAEVKIDTCVTVESWDEIAARVRECLVAMELK